jgi:hypothetical protein
VKVAIHQPQYLPWLGYLAKWAAADLFIFLDTVQYEKNGWQNRNRVKTARGPAWLTVPVHAPLGTPIAEVMLDTRQAWRRRHLRAIEHAYADAPMFARVHASLAALYATEWTALAPVAAATATWMARELEIAVPARFASELGVAATDPTARLVALCRAVGADTYLAGRDGVTYMDLAQFAAAGIVVRAQRYAHPVYRQNHGAFVPNLSALDLVLNEAEAARIVRSGDAWDAVPP